MYDVKSFLNFVGSSIQTVDYVLEIVVYEARCLFRDKIVGLKELHVFDNVLMKVFQGDWGSDVLDNMAGKPVEAFCPNLKLLNQISLIKLDSLWAEHINFWMFPLIFTDVFYVTWGACREAFMTPGQALPPHGRPLGRLNSTDLKDIIQKVRQD